jgi:hypothetical protein
MKPYFAKYIPVEGPIKAGDRYVIRKSLGLGAYTDGYIGTAAIDFTPEAQRDQEASILRLYLCSRDIKVGDKDVHTQIMQSEGEEIIHEVKYDYQLEMMKGLAEANNLVPYKVIGPISPQATWMKEGAELEEDEWEYVCINLKHGWTEIQVPKDHFDTINRQMFTHGITIKGPCGHFH